MELFSNLSRDGLEKETETLGRELFQSDIYLAKIKLAYTGSSASGARYIAFTFDIDGKSFMETIYITNKEGKHYYLHKTDSSKKIPLPGFLTVDNICLLASGKPLANQTAEEKIVKVYDPEQKQEVPKGMPVLVDLLNKEVRLGILKQLVDKTAKNSSGKYEPTGEHREINAIDRVFHSQYKLTCHEIMELKEKCAKDGSDMKTFLNDPEFINNPSNMYETWLKKFKDQVQDRTTKKASTQQAGSISAGFTDTQSTGDSLFG